MRQIIVTSPTGKKVIVGERDYERARFWINQNRYFQEADAFGIDEEVLNKISDVRYLVFRLWDGRIFRVSMEDFKRYAWFYPPKDDPSYKANSSVFRPKLVMTIKQFQKLYEAFEEKEHQALEKEILMTL